jgi:hypothetical protein
MPLKFPFQQSFLYLRTSFRLPEIPDVQELIWLISLYGKIIRNHLKNTISSPPPSLKSDFFFKIPISSVLRLKSPATKIKKPGFLIAQLTLPRSKAGLFIGALTE